MYNFEDEKQRQAKIAAQIRRQYEDRSESDFERLKRLDAKVKRPPEILAYTIGIIGALVLGVGMCLAMQVIGSAALMPPGIVVGVVGILIVAANYFIYCAFLKSRKKRYAAEIAELSGKLLNE